MKKTTNTDDPRLSEICTMSVAMEMLKCSNQHVRDLVQVHKRVREYPLASNFKMYNIADLKKELNRKKK